MTDVKRSEAGSGQGGGDVVLITGASGFIAAALIAKLSERYTVVGLDRAGPPDPPPPAAAVDFDLGSDEAVRTALNEVRARYGNRIASVIHLAAYYDITGEPNPLYEKITVQGTQRLIDGLQSFEVGQFVFASTMLVHKPTPTPDERINEDSPIAPAWAYPQSKVDTEAMLHERRGEIPVVFLRPGGGLRWRWALSVPCAADFTDLRASTDLALLPGNAVRSAVVGAPRRFGRCRATSG